MSAPIIIPTPAESRWDGGQLVFQELLFQGDCPSRYALARLEHWRGDDGWLCYVSSRCRGDAGV